MDARINRCFVRPGQQDYGARVRSSYILQMVGRCEACQTAAAVRHVKLLFILSRRRLHASISGKFPLRFLRPCSDRSTRPTCHLLLLLSVGKARATDDRVAQRQDRRVFVASARIHFCRPCATDCCCCCMDLFVCSNGLFVMSSQ